MKHLHIHPDDFRWLRRWLRSNLLLLAAATMLLITAGTKPDIPIMPIHAASTAAEFDDVELPPETELVLLESRRPNPVAPQGWRKTKDGWEHVSTWPQPGKSINQWIDTQHDQEPPWLRHTFARLRTISPLMIALMQITAIALIVNVSRRE